MSLPDKDADNFFLPNICSPRAVFLLVVIAELFVLVLVLAWTGAGTFDWNRLALTSLFVQWIVLVSAAVICSLRPLLYRANPAVITGTCLSVCLAVTSLFTLISIWIMGSLSLSTLSPGAPVSFWQEQDGQLLRNNIIALIMGTMVLRYFFLQKEVLRQQQAELNSRIQSLHSRIQPHFLFNSMNTIASLITSRPQIAEQVVEDLADLFRASLDKATILISVKEEIALARQYLNIESLRFGERLNTVWKTDEFSPDAVIPKLCLQPILENAVYHGIQPDPQGGEVHINICSEKQIITLTVRNTLPQQDVDNSSHGNKMALNNITDRLQALYGDEAGLQTRIYQSDNRSWFETTLNCPDRSKS
ncbi:sensor histidine kinase [Sansalvadorimonas verongulae]|uniref:sensor histidine kinase n=1 Tax=Sansalvadorimonas verongulae TaxID=2172824 RepID=UPI0012BC63FA|nr:histidine kinase [Sansalvadorimonas verongulae]MTI15295.1 sensor histidine kinase [Sansalvadorimonas verongulae]